MLDATAHATAIPNCDCGCAAPSPPSTLTGDVRRYILSQPDALLVAWLQLAPQAVDVLSARERTHALGLLVDTGAPYTEEYRNGQCAAYVRQQLVSGDHVQHAGRASMAVGAAIWIKDGKARRRYTVEKHGERTIYLRGERGAVLKLIDPLMTGACWTGWLDGDRRTRTITLRRQPDGLFVRVRGA